MWVSLQICYLVFNKTLSNTTKGPFQELFSMSYHVSDQWCQWKTILDLNLRGKMDAGAVMAFYLKSRKTNPNVNQTQEQYTGRDQATSKW